MTSRDLIRRRVAQGVGKPDYAARRAAALAALAFPRRGPQPVLGDGLLARFSAKARSLASTVDVADDASPAAAARAVAGYLAAHGLGKRIVASPDLADFDGAAAGLDVTWGGAGRDDAVGLTGCFCAIAETGALMLLSSPHTPATVSLLPETHIAIVRAGRIVSTMEDAFARLRAEHGSLPRAVNFISGPSRTGDIEQTLVLGAHGPCRVHVVVLQGGKK